MTARAYRVEDGSIWHLPELTVDLGWGTGYYQRTPDDCFRAAVATVTQIDYDELGGVPVRGGVDIPLGVFVFAAEQGLEAERVESLVTGPDEPWLALSDRCEEIGGDHHICVAAGDRIVFDPWNFVTPAGDPAIAAMPLGLRPTHGYRFHRPTY